MKLSAELNESLNIQATNEYSNMLLYKALESYFENLQLKNIAKYFSNQAQHEKEHGDKFIDHINSRTGGSVVIGEVNQPPEVPSEISGIADLYVLREEETTESIEDIYDLAFESKSFMDLGFLQSMLDEQVSEEDEANELALKLKSTSDLVLFDKLMG